MKRSYLTIQANRLVRYLLERSIRELPDEDLGRSAVVFAPHPDDETLGCGGTVIRRIRAGACVDVVFVTDGAASHNRVMSKETLIEIRQKEAKAAMEVLGVCRDRITFMNVPDGKVYLRAVQVQEQVQEILERLEPRQVFIPCFHEWVPDHLAVNRIVLAALDACGQWPVVYEYPVWFWNHWPWVAGHLGRETLYRMKVSFCANIQMNLLKRFRSAVFVGDVLDLKRKALEEYRSQMMRLIPGVQWPTLGDVGGGEFLDCFFQKRELFYSYRMTPLQADA